MGVFIFQTEDIFAKQDGKVRKLLAGVTSLGPTVPAEQLVFVSNHVAKVLEAKSSQFKSVDLRPQDTKLEWVRLEASIILDLPAARTTEEELSDDLVFPIQKMEENLKHCKFATEFWWTVTCSVNLSKTRRKETTEIRVSPLIRRTRSALKFIFQLKVVSLDPQILH